MHGYYPEDPKEAYLVDWVCDTAEDLFISGKQMIIFKAEGTDEANQGFKDCFAHLSRQLEKYLKEGQEFMVGDKLTIADMRVLSLYHNGPLNDTFVNEEAHNLAAEDFKNYPKLHAYVEKASKHFEEHWLTRGKYVF